MVAKGIPEPGRVRSIRLSPMMDEAASSRAAQLGVAVEDFLAGLIERQLAATEANAALAPFQQQVAKSQMTEDELEEFFDDLRSEVWRESEGRQP